MSTDAYQRAAAREKRIWAPFRYSFPFNDGQKDDREVIFGLYAGSYANQHQYLQEIEYADLLNLLDDYNAKIAELTVQEQVQIENIVAERYLASIDKAVHDQKMATKAAEISTEDAMMTAKIAALATDRAALETMAVRVTSETEKTAAKITEIQTYIDIEGYNLSEVDIEIAEKEIQSAKVDIQKLDAANEVLRIQLDIVNAALQLVDVDLQIARTRVDIANVDRNIAKIGLLPSELTIAQAQTTIAEAELPIAQERVALAEAKSAEVDKEITYYEVTLPAQETTNFNNKLSLQNLKQIIREDELRKRREEKELEISDRLALATLDITFANTDKTHQAQLDQQRVGVMETRVTNVRSKVEAAVQKAETLASADIASELTHTIKKKAETP